ncbi:hypothetical protein FG93_02381 [Bosea sp. LC85]|nr:hypothetical protein FG93_02381 [Bosea sp. LC85]
MNPAVSSPAPVTAPGASRVLAGYRVVVFHEVALP